MGDRKCSRLPRIMAIVFLSIVGGAGLQMRPTGQPRLVSIEPMVAMGGEFCEPTPVAANFTEQGSQLGRPGAASAETGKYDVSKRPPLRTIHDPYAGYSAIAVDSANNEVVMTDETLFRVLAYDRLANTPPTATMTEPKRIIGGVKTQMEFQCGLYIDPNNGDIYAINGDTVEKAVIFSRKAKGDVPPDRTFVTPHGTAGIVVDEARQDLYLTVQHTHAVVVYNKMAKGDDPPARLLQGNHTLLADPHGIALDLKNDLIFVTNYGTLHQFLPNDAGKLFKSNWPLQKPVPGSGEMRAPSITVYRRDASGDTAPLRVIQGSRTRLDWPAGLAFHPERNELFVANDMDDSILVFDASARGDIAPVRVLKGPKTLVKNPSGLYLDLKNNELWVANFGNHTATVYSPAASGDTAPLRVIRSAPLGTPAPMLGNAHPLAYDTKRDEILVPN
jgi:DNA-binding beta-propeller fold protein YncE